MKSDDPRPAIWRQSSIPAQVSSKIGATSHHNEEPLGEQDVEILPSNAESRDRPGSDATLFSKSPAKHESRYTRSSASSTAYSPSRRSRRSSLRESNRHVWRLAHSDCTDFSISSVPSPPPIAELPTAHIPEPLRRHPIGAAHGMSHSPASPLAKPNSGRVLRPLPQKVRYASGQNISSRDHLWASDVFHDGHDGAPNDWPLRSQIGWRPRRFSSDNSESCSSDSVPAEKPRTRPHENARLGDPRTIKSSGGDGPNLEGVSNDRNDPNIQSEGPEADARSEESDHSGHSEMPTSDISQAQEKEAKTTPLESSGTSPAFERAYPPIQDPVDPARQLPKGSLMFQRSVFLAVLICLNGAALVAALLSPRHLWILVFMVFIKSKDMASTILSAICLTLRSCCFWSKPDDEVPQQWILSLVSAYSETDEQIMKTVTSVQKHDISPHKQVLCIILDGKTKDIRSHLTSSVASFRRSYVTFRHVRSEIRIDAGFMGTHPVIVMEKVKNAGKKDSLILCHDIFNTTRSEAPLYTKLLKQEIFEQVLPYLTKDDSFKGFNMIFCTDADSTVHEDAIRRLANALFRDPFAIAACGVLLAEMIPNLEWSTWHLFQQFQYTFGQYIRRQAEGLWGKVTCLPGCISMVAVRHEMAGALSMYARPVKNHMFFRHQVQYLGTDRRLTYCMLAQHNRLRTLFVPGAISETVAPQTLSHYISQRQRWASNAYFNDCFYLFGTQQIYITRLWAMVDIVRLSFIYYRVANSILFIYGLTRNWQFIKIVPLLVVTQTPTVWYLALMIFREPILRRRAHKLICGLLVNKILSPVLSIIVFTKIAFHLGNQAWGKTGLSTKAQPPIVDIIPHPSSLDSSSSWSPRRLATLVRNAVQHRSSGSNSSLSQNSACAESKTQEGLDNSNAFMLRSVSPRTPKRPSRQDIPG